MKYVTVIGLEIHAELKTNTKLFCRCANTSSDLQTPPNTAICPVCIGLPGALPVINQAAMAATITLGQTLGATIPTVTKWDRKNYFYPDLPKSYQISQYDEPLCSGGAITWRDRQGHEHSVELTRIHLEEDTGKLIHPAGTNYSLIDYNRSSIPLLELVTEPVIESAAIAKQFCEQYQLHLRELGIAEASMEKGQMRCEANISVVPTELAGDPATRLSGTKVEVKNLNSFKSLERAIEFEIARHTQALESGGKLYQETRGWNESKGETYVMRTKETSDDYRYFPDPDLLPLPITDAFKREASQEHVSGRGRVSEILAQSGAKTDFVYTVVNDDTRREYFEALVRSGLKSEAYALAVQWLAQEPQIMQFEASEMQQALESVFAGLVRPSLLKQAVGESSPGALGGTIEQLTARDQHSNFDTVVQDVLSAYPQEVMRYKEGEVRLFGFFVGKVRAALGGAGDPSAIAAELKKQLQ